MSFAPLPTGGGGGVSPAEVEGHLLVCEALEYVTGIQTSFGEKDAVRLNVYDVTSREVHQDVLWFSGRLVGQLKRAIGIRLLVVMGKGTAKPGQSAPWELLDAHGNEEASAKADAFVKSVAPTFAAMPAPAAPTAPAPATPAAAQVSALDAALANL